MVDEQHENIPMSDIAYTDLSNVNINGAAKTDKTTVFRLDKLVMRVYRDMKYLRFFLDYNKIADVTKVKQQQTFLFPDIDAMGDTITEHKINGLRQKTYINSYGSDTKETAAVPSIGITKRPVSYEAENGKLIF